MHNPPAPRRLQAAPSSRRFRSLRRNALATASFPVSKSPRLDACRGAPTSTERPDLGFRLGPSSPLGLEDFSVRRKSTSPQSTEAGLLAVGSLAHSTEPGLGPVSCRHQRNSKRDTTRRSQKSLKHSSSTSVCAGPGSTLAAAAQAGPALGTQGTRPGGRRHPGLGLHTWSLSRRICPGNRNPQKHLLVKAKVGGGQPTRERGQSRRRAISLTTSPLRSPNTREADTGEGPGRTAGP